MPRSPSPVDIYIRVSRVGGREHLISPDEQERRARALGEAQQLTIGEVFTDLDESGGNWDRPGLQEALARVRAGRSGGLIVAWLDRLSRDSEHSHRLVREITEAGGRIYAPDAPSDWTSPEGELQAGIFFAFGQYTRSRARAGFESAKERAIMAGIPVANRTRVGYIQRQDRRLEPDPATAPIVKEVFERRAAGEGPTALGQFLEEHGVLTSQGSSTWTKQAVADLLSSRVYLGELSYGRDRRYVNPSAHEPLVDLATWMAAQHPRGRRLQPPRGGGGYSLTGILRCQACGYAMQGTTTSRGRRMYRCVRRHAGGVCPNPARAYAGPVEEAAERAFWALTEDLRAEPIASESVDLSRFAQELERAEQRLAQAMTPEVQDAAGDSWAAMIRERRAERDVAATALADARGHVGEGARALPGPETLRAVWDRATPADRRELLAARFDAFALCRDAEGLTVVAFPAGAGLVGLSRRGFRRTPSLRPIDIPDDARVVPLKQPREGVTNG